MRRLGIHQVISRIDAAIANWMERYGLLLLRISLGVVFIWFGALKPFRISPADELIERTVYWIDPDIFILILGVWEVAIGLCLPIRPLIRLGVLLLLLQMPGTFLPLVLISAAIVVGGTVRSPEREPRLK